ncbi:hypothetical protein FRC03_002159 [Tulasnella sp. 419]|nr:hypothetical protein FRC03_002159 [Tulasnella sp. 419]
MWSNIYLLPSLLVLSNQVAAIPVEPRALTGFVNKGLVAFGLVPSRARDSTGDTLGGLGSAVAIKRGTFKKTINGTFVGTFVTQPDRGYNVEGTVDWQTRQHEFDFVLTPYDGATPLSFADAQQTLKLKYKKTLLYRERGLKKPTGLDALGVRPANPVDPELPIPSGTKNTLSLDAEGLVLNNDKTFWVSDEYGAYVYRFLPSGTLLSVIKPPEAVIPYVNGSINFSSADEPDRGRAANAGFEGLTISSDGKTLYAMLQSATIQDGGADKATSRHTRLFAWKVQPLLTSLKPPLVGEWVVPLPQTSKGKTLAQSEIHYLNEKQFLVLSRDGKGRGDDEHDTKSAYKSVDVFDITSATDIHGTLFDGATPVAPNGVLEPSVTPATYTPFVNILDSAQLSRFSLHNGGTSDAMLINAKWEGLALAPTQDPTTPDDYFLFVFSDNDFITLDGVAAGQPYSSSYGEDLDSQVLVYRVTLPTVARGSVEKSIGI